MHFIISTLFCLVIFFSQAHAQHDIGQWSEVGIQFNPTPTWQAKANAQVRFNGNIRNFHFFKTDAGLGRALSKHIQFFVLYRLNVVQGATTWQRQHFIFLDPIFKWPLAPQWTFDFRSRLHIRLGDRGRGVVRLRAQITRRIDNASPVSAWFLSVEPFIQTTELGPRQRFNQNRIVTGIRLNLSSQATLAFYYLLRSDHDVRWMHLHVPGLALSLKL